MISSLRVARPAAARRSLTVAAVTLAIAAQLSARPATTSGSVTLPHRLVAASQELIAGTGSGSPNPPNCPGGGDGGPALSATLCVPTRMKNVAVDGTSFDVQDNLYNPAAFRHIVVGGTISSFQDASLYPASGGNAKTVCDGAGTTCYQIDAIHYNNRVLKTNPDGSTVYYGTGATGYAGDGGPATGATFGDNQYLLDIASDGAGNLFVADGQNKAIRRVDTSGIITTMPGLSLSEPSGVAVDGVGDLFIADPSLSGVYRVQGVAQGGPPAGGPLGSRENPGGRNRSEASGCSQRACADPVNTATGNLSESYTDLSIAGRGLALSFTRDYNSALADANGPLGYGWSFSYGVSLTVGAQSVTVNQEDGSQIIFTVANGAYQAPPRVLATLARNGDGTYTLTRRARTTLLFDSSGRLTAERDLNGYTTTVAYPSSSSTVVTDPAGRTLTLGYTGGHITSLTDSAAPARVVTFRYQDGAGNLTSVVDVGGGTTTFTYDASHRLLTLRQPKYFGDTTTTPAPVVTSHYDSSGRVDRQTDQVGRSTTFDYTSIPGSTKVTDPKGNVSVYAYRFGELVSETRGFGTPQAATWTYYYDPNTVELTRVVDPNGNRETRSYDANGNLVSTVDPLGRTTTFTYDALNDLTSTTDPAGVRRSITYDGAGNLLTDSTPLLDAAGHVAATRTTTYHYGGGSPVFAGDVASVTDADGNVTSYGYDAFGDRTRVVQPPTAENPAGDKTTYAYNTGTGYLAASVSPKGNVAGAIAANFTTAFVTDAFGQMTNVRDPLWSAATPTAHQTVRHYDANHNVDYTIDGDGNKTTLVYDAANQLLQQSRPDGTILRNDYWPDGTLHDQVDGKNNPTAYAYDPLGHLAAATDPLGRVTTFVYDAVGNLTSATAPGTGSGNGLNATTYSYDAANQLTAESFSTSSDGATTPAVSNIAYDPDGRRTAMTDGTGTSAWSWDSLGRLTSSTDGSGATVGYGYDLNANLTSIAYPGGSAVTRHFDAAGRMDWLQDWSGNRTTFSYDPNSSLVAQTLPAGTGVVDAASYDNANMVAAMTDAKSGTSFASFTYTHDGAGLLASASSTGLAQAAESYHYTPLDQLASVNAGFYHYDAADNLTGLPSGGTQAFDNANQLCWTTAGSPIGASACGSTPPALATVYSFNDRGDRTTVAGPSGAQSLGYDLANRLTSVTGAGPGGLVNSSYTYNGDGLRVTKTVSGASQAFVWDQADSLPAILSDGANRYLYGPDGLPLEQMDVASGAIVWLHHDQLGSTRVVTDSTGNVVATRSYDAYGNQVATTGSAKAPLGYAGQYTDAETGLVYLRARYYDPSTGQFISRDPLVALTGSAYGYVYGNPLNATDPSGLVCVTLWDKNCESFAQQHAKGAQQVANFAGGVLNGITLGHGRGIIDNFGGTKGKVNYCSTEYAVGTVVGVGIDAYGVIQALPYAEVPAGPTPPGFDPETWEFRGASRGIAENHWWDPEGGEWRWHDVDRWHDTPHWDYNPWDAWNSPWQHI